MRIPVITLLGLTVLFAVAGIKVASDNGGPFAWVGAMLPAAALLYMAVRVWKRDPFQNALLTVLSIWVWVSISAALLAMVRWLIVGHN